MRMFNKNRQKILHYPVINNINIFNIWKPLYFFMTYYIFSIRLLYFCCAASNWIFYCIFWFVLTPLYTNLTNTPYIYLCNKSSCPASLFFCKIYSYVIASVSWVEIHFGLIFLLAWQNYSFCKVNIFFHDISIMTNVKNTLLWSAPNF